MPGQNVTAGDHDVKLQLFHAKCAGPCCIQIGVMGQNFKTKGFQKLDHPPPDARDAHNADGLVPVPTGSSVRYREWVAPRREPI